jgi:hypothetical protein
MQRNRYNKEKRALKEEMKQMKNDNRVQKVMVAYVQHNM